MTTPHILALSATVKLTPLAAALSLALNSGDVLAAPLETEAGPRPTAVADAAPSDLYIVQLREAPLATYDGSLAEQVRGSDQK